MLAKVLGRDGWQHWGPYLSERPVGHCGARTTAPTGTAWEYFPHDHARSPRLPMGGEDGDRGPYPISEQLVCLSLALLERRGSHPEGAPVRGSPTPKGTTVRTFKEQYFYLDATSLPIRI